MMLISMQRPPTIASVGDLVNDPWSSSAPKLRHEQKEYPPWAEQGLEPSSNCSSITIHPGVVQHKVADVVVKVEVFSDLTFGLLDDLKGPTQLAHDDPAPLSANGLTRGRRLVLYNCISQKSAYTNISHFICIYLNELPTQKLVHIQGLDVVALAVNVLLMYFSQTARHIDKESESGGRISHSHPTLLSHLLQK